MTDIQIVVLTAIAAGLVGSVATALRIGEAHVEDIDEIDFRISRRKQARADTGRCIYCGEPLAAEAKALRTQKPEAPVHSFVCSSCSPASDLV